MNYIRCLLAILLLASPLSGTQQPPPPIVDPEIKDLQWNRYETANFEILSIDKTQGDYLVTNIEQLKSWICLRWGFKDVNFNSKCRVVCIPTKALFVKLFGSQDSCYRVDDKQAVVWLSLEDSHWKTSIVPKLLTEICLQNIERQTGRKFPLWVHSGTAMLDIDLPQIRQNLGNINYIYTKDLKVSWSKEIFTMTPDTLNKQNSVVKVWFDPECAALCLMLVKEFGLQKFNQFIASSDPEIALQTVYGFKSYDDFNLNFKKYMYNLSCDIIGQGQKIPPNVYFTWKY